MHPSVAGDVSCGELIEITLRRRQLNGDVRVTSHMMDVLRRPAKCDGRDREGCRHISHTVVIINIDQGDLQTQRGEMGGN